MSISSTKTPLVGMTIEDLREVTASLGMPKFTATQLAQWIYGKRVNDFSQMNNISKVSREKLAERYCVGFEAPINAQHSSDGTIKYLFDAGDGKAVESVYIPEDDRATLCISSQKGCKMNCSFCMTGKQGFHGNLTAHQIINQVLSIPESESLTNVVYMGMGEPMDNYDAVVKTIQILTSSWGLAWSPKRITVSTIGKLRELRRLCEETSVHIAISVHSPIHEQRESLMPVERAFPIKDVMALLCQYDFSHQRRLSIEYIMWKGVNDGMNHANALAKLLRGVDARVNLIRFHAIPDTDLQTSGDRQMIAFRDELNRLGITCTIRRSRGEDIAAACGMLAGKTE